MTLLLQKIADVESLLATGMSDRGVARQLKVGRAAVGKIRRHEYPVQQLRGVGEAVPTPSGPYVWCEGCRHRVQKPCLACWLRERENCTNFSKGR